jgi:predicted aldo/keto reductase-like oxidoreductase
MQYRTVPKNGDRLSALGFGCMRLPQPKGTPGDGKIDKDRALSQIQYAVDHGVNYLDTAMPYHLGASEPFLGEVFRNGLRDKVNLATKLPPWSVKKSADMDHILTAQLDRLATDRIDYYLLHGLEMANWQKLKNLGVLDFLERAKKQGRIKNAGFSFHGDLESFRTIVDAYDWECCQIQYNFLDELNQAGKAGLQYAASKNLGVIIMEPLRGGNLAGRVPREVAAIWDSAEVKRTPAEWALRWVWNHPEVTVVLSGMNDQGQVEENVRVAAGAQPHSLTEDELALIARVEATYRRLMKAGCTGCRYCMPCPSGVHIPGCFEIYNRYHMFNDKRTARLFYATWLSGGLGAPKAMASLCQKCGKCEKACPQHLPIQELLEDVKATFEGPGMRFLAGFMSVFSGFQRRSSIRRARSGRRK